MSRCVNFWLVNPVIWSREMVRVYNNWLVLNQLDKVFPVSSEPERCVSVRGGEREWELGAVWRPSLALSSAAVTRRRQGRFITLSPSVRSHTFDIWQLPGRPWRLEGKLKATLKLQERVLRVTVTVWMNRARHTAQWVGLGLYSRDPLWPIILFASLNDFIP